MTNNTGIARWVRGEAELQKHWPLSHGKIFELRRLGLLRPVRVGRAVFFDLEQVASMMESLRAEQYGEAETSTS